MSDLISRSALLAKMKQTSRYFAVKFDIEEAPAVDAVPMVHGTPVPHIETFCNSDGVPVVEYVVGYECPFCGDDGIKNYCPNCGAKMDGERKEDGDNESK